MVKMTVKRLIVSVLVVVSLVWVVAPVGIGIHSLDVFQASSIEVFTIENVATIVISVHVKEAASFIAPACVITAIPKVGIPRVTTWDRGHPAVGKGFSKGIFAKCARDKQSREHEQRDFEQKAHL
jgi:hypothetical protein